MADPNDSKRAQSSDVLTCACGNQQPRAEIEPREADPTAPDAPRLRACARCGSATDWKEGIYRS